MAEFKVAGIDGVMLSLGEAAEIPEDVLDQMLQAQADIAVPAIKAKGQAYGLVRTGQMLRSIKAGKPKWAKGVRVQYITPTGSRRRGKTETRNAEIAFIAEYGKRNQKARPFMRDAIEAAGDSMEQAAAARYDAWLQSKDL